MSEERDRLEKFAAMMVENHVFLGVEADIRAVLSALEAAEARVKELEVAQREVCAARDAHFANLQRARAENEALRAGRDRLEAALAALPCADFPAGTGTCREHDGTGLWCEPCKARAALAAQGSASEEER